MTLTLSQSQYSLIEKARNVGHSNMAVPLSDEACGYLVARIVHDLSQERDFPEIPRDIPPFFETSPVSALGLQGLDFDALVGRLFSTIANSDMYFSCLATLLKARLKFE